MKLIEFRKLDNHRKLSQLFDSTVIRFLLVGGINSLFGFAAFIAIAYLGGQTWQALLGGNLAGILFNFLTIGGVVFRDLTFKRIPRFIAAYLGLFVLNLESISELTSISPLDRITAQALLTIPMAILSYLIMSRLVFQIRRDDFTARTDLT